MKTADLLTDAAIAPVAGYAATKVMEPVNMELYQLESDQDRQREDDARPGSPFQIAADKTLTRLGIHLNGPAREKSGMAFHYGLAISWSPTYALLRRTTGISPALAGLASGAAMAVTVDEGLTPLLGFSAPNRAYPAITRLRGVAAHLAFGLALAAVTAKPPGHSSATAQPPSADPPAPDGRSRCPLPGPALQGRTLTGHHRHQAQLQAAVHVQLEPAVGVHVGPEQRRQRPTVRRWGLSNERLCSTFGGDER